MEGKLRQEADKHGISAAEYALNILSAHLEPQGGTAAPFYATATPKQWNQAFDAWVDSHPLPDSALGRESFYEGGA